MIVNGDNVTCYALFNEHFNKYDTLWNGENGATYFYQNEKCYDPISQEAWMSHNGTVNGYAAYKVANDVKEHYAVGLGYLFILVKIMILQKCKFKWIVQLKYQIAKV